jgi:teichuronic acid biosynthesis glycosyltransferase TuaG
MTKVSIIIPTYNSEKFINRTIQSVIDQTYKDWELIIVDDLSKDKTREILNEWKKKDERIHLIFLDKNSGGPAHPKNVAISETHGKYIAYLDHDDEWMKDKLEKQINVLEKDPKIGFISCEADMLDKNGKLLYTTTTSIVPDSGVFPAILSTNFFTSNSSLVIPKKVIDEVGGRDENPEIGPSEDREYELRIAAAGYKFYVVHEVLIKYYSHDGSPYTRPYYSNSSLKYISYYKKYNLEYILYEDFVKEFIRLDDTQNSKKYCKLLISKKPYYIRYDLIYIFLLFGKLGMFFIRQILLLQSNILYFLGKKSKYEADQYATYFKKVTKKINKINVIITSTVKCSEKPVSYSKVRSVFTKEERLAQTIQTIESVRKYMPNAYITLIEIGQEYSENSKIEKLVDQYINLSKNKTIRFFVDGIFKGLGEAVGIIFAYKRIDKTYLNYIKLSGRYILNNNFKLENFTSEKPFSGKVYDEKTISTRLYYFKNQYLLDWKVKHIMSIPFLLLNRSIERVLYILIGGKNINPVDTLGVSGKIGVNGEIIEE